MKIERKLIVTLCLIVSASFLLILLVSIAAGIQNTIEGRSQVSTVRNLAEVMVRQRAPLSEATNRFGLGTSLSETVVPDYCARFSISKEAVSAKARQYQKTVFFTPNADATLFLFLDGSDSIVDYEIGAQ